MNLTDTTTPHKAGPVDAVRGVDARALARAALASCCDQVRLNTPGAQRGEDPAFTHQLRIGLRRLRVALKLFATLLEPTDTLQGELKWVFSRLGDQRQLDVLLRDVIVPLAESAPTAALSALRSATQQAREKRRRAVQHALSGKRYARLLRALDALQSSLAEHDEPSPSARKWSRKKLTRLRERTLAQYAPARTGDPHERHQLRKQFKKLRYASELTSALFKKKRVKRYLAALADVQEVLGALNDVAVGRVELQRLSAGRHVELGSALQACDARLSEYEAHEQHKLEAALRAHADARPFWI
jgi:triphosphatase